MLRNLISGSPAAGGGICSCWPGGRWAKAPRGVAAGVQTAARERRGRNGSLEP